MDIVILSRLQFAVTSMFHFIFVPLTIGLSLLIAYMETRYVTTGDPLYRSMAKYWGRLFLINFALGIVTGLTMEFQFGMNWAEYSKYVGDIFGAPLAIESTVAFFLESTFIGIWIYGWDRISPRKHALAIWLVALATNLSALWILLANGWMQHPVGFVLRNNRAEMVDFGALLTNTYGWLKFLHTLFASYTIGAFFVMGVSAYHLLRPQRSSFFRRSFGIAAVFGLASSFLLFIVGDFHASEVARTQPAKFAAMESHWETTASAPYTFIVLPDPDHERNAFEALKVPGMLSLLAFHDSKAQVTGLRDIPREMRPPMMPVHVSFRGMAGLGMLFILLSLIASILFWRGRLESSPRFLRLMLLALPLPYVAGQLGWIVAEVGRQPWLVYGVFRTADGVSKAVTTAEVALSLAGFTLIYGSLAAIDIYLLCRHASREPGVEPAELAGRTEG